MISHVFVAVAEFDPAFRFYSEVLEELGLVQKFCDASRPWAGWMSPHAARPLFLIGSPFNGEPAQGGNGQMIALLAPSRIAVDLAYARAIALGAACEGQPGLRPHYHPDYYGAYFRDLDGNKICVVCHDAETL
ncbi:MAG TPA: VOC family protein [Burkholderiaceae bacterium]|jgi:catechol 2,3-dioxygenase-like lactoylglutathione lyase family enzyme